MFKMDVKRIKLLKKHIVTDVVVLVVMKNIVLLIAISLVLSCGKDKVVLLPEISHSDISDLKDVSAAYIFYDETKQDSTELNRRNLISTTNWLINVDKRLTLKQVIPHIKFLQDKKGNSSHKNENARNYFTCNDTSKKNLGFIEFTDVIYHEETIREYNKNHVYKTKPDQEIYIEVRSLDSISVHFATGDCTSTNPTNKDDLLNGIKSDLLQEGLIVLHLGYYKNSSFQDYIDIKSKLNSLDLGHVIISKDEFIFN